MPSFHVSWDGRGGQGYEVSSIGDNRFSALYATMPDGRTIEQWYQCDIKGYQMGGRDWKLGKGKPPLFPYPKDHLWQMYLNLWRHWTILNSNAVIELFQAARLQNNILVDSYADPRESNPNSINQARALATIINEWFLSIDQVRIQIAPELGYK